MIELWLSFLHAIITDSSFATKTKNPLTPRVWGGLLPNPPAINQHPGKVNFFTNLETAGKLSCQYLVNMADDLSWDVQLQV